MPRVFDREAVATPSTNQVYREPTTGYGALIKPLVVVGVVLFLFIVLHSFLGYWLESVSSKEVAIQMHAGQPIAVVGPGNYTDMTPFASLQRIDASELPFTASDPEVLTNDSQRIGVTVQGTVRRPGMDHPDLLLANWSRFSTFYTNNDSLLGIKDNPGLMQNLSLQAIKVCVGNSTFNDAAIGTGRDQLRGCVDNELNNLARGYSLSVNNIVVPNVTISQTVQQSLDAITKARYDQAVADQQVQTAKSQGDQQVAQQEAAIRAQNATAQEQARQDAITAGLNQIALQAQNGVIQQQKANDLLAAQQDVQIQQQWADAQAQRARGTNADQATIAAIYQNDPAYANQKAIEAEASAYGRTDKVIVPAGTNPNVIIGNGTQPTQQTVVQAPGH